MIRCNLSSLNPILFVNIVKKNNNNYLKNFLPLDIFLLVTPWTAQKIATSKFITKKNK